MSLGPKHTKLAGYVGYLTQALVINFPPLLFITFINTYSLSMSKISLLILVSFAVQLSVDAFAAKFSSRLNIRRTMLFAFSSAAIGIMGFGFLPELLPNPFVALLICTFVASIGAGFVEVFVSPIIEACPTGKKSAAMSILHSFYAWGHAGIIILSTLFFTFIGIEHWRILSFIWAIIPIIGFIGFSIVPIYTLAGDKKEIEATAKKEPLWKSRFFIIFFIIMVCAGAAEQVLAQWASTFAESGLGVNKAIGDVLGPCSFALLMGISRIIYARSSSRIDLRHFILASSVLCVAAYTVVAISQTPAISLIACALCGLGAGMMWPGTYSLAAKNLPTMSIKTFALLALGGDVGCILGPAVAGVVAEKFGNDLRIGFAISILFPLIMTILLLTINKKRKETSKNEQP